MTGPPTPPATSPVELQDQARSNLRERSAQSSAQAMSDTRPDIYQTALSAIVDLIKRNDYAGLVKVTEQLDFTTISDSQPSRLFVVAPLVLGHLVLDNTPAARHAFYRLPGNLMDLPFSQALLSLVTATINREHAMVYEQAGGLLSLVVQPEFPDGQLAEITSALLSVFIEAFRRRTFELLSKAYTSLPLKLASIYLGWPEEKVIAVAGTHGWSYDPSTEVFTPKTTRVTLPKPSSFSTLGTFHLVVDSVARLEV